jgi:hypothetical protein
MYEPWEINKEHLSGTDRFDEAMSELLNSRKNQLFFVLIEFLVSLQLHQY